MVLAAEMQLALWARPLCSADVCEEKCLLISYEGIRQMHCLVTLQTTSSGLDP